MRDGVREQLVDFRHFEVLQDVYWSRNRLNIAKVKLHCVLLSSLICRVVSFCSRAAVIWYENLHTKLCTHFMICSNLQMTYLMAKVVSVTKVADKRRPNKTCKIFVYIALVADRRGDIFSQFSKNAEDKLLKFHVLLSVLRISLPIGKRASSTESYHSGCSERYVTKMATKCESTAHEPSNPSVILSDSVPDSFRSTCAISVCM